MAEIPDHLVPTDGLTNSFIRFDGLDVNHRDGGADCRFGIYNENGNHLSDFVVEVSSNDRGVSGTIADAHHQMCDVLRQWLYMTDQMRSAYEKPKE